MADRTSLLAKVATSAIHVGAVGIGLACLAGGLASWGDAFTPRASEARLWLLAAASVIYLLRFIVTQFVMLRRAYPWSEAVGVGVWVALVQLSLVMVGGTVTGPVGAVTVLGVVLYLIGSLLNTVSEAMRLAWKRDPAHRGRLYDRGLFGWSMHINYFGDSVLFTGFALIAGSWWAALVPAIMTAMFVGLHIPRLDAHLAARYGEQFDRYAARVRKFIPYVY
ncbi:DUF1295 domain-containing protein [Demequina sp.]|uniref:DUF1295 domain-containing protein n=1 Tax=Demequina sp. TaxID=2050685 RepID=UPI003A85EF27